MRRAIPTWCEKLDIWTQLAGVAVASIGVVVQLGAVAAAHLSDDPITAVSWLDRGFWIAGVGGAGLVYGIKVDAGGSVKTQGGPRTYEPPERRWPAALYALTLTPLWGWLGLIVGLLLLIALVAGGIEHGADIFFRGITRAERRTG